MTSFQPDARPACGVSPVRGWFTSERCPGESRPAEFERYVRYHEAPLQ